MFEDAYRGRRVLVTGHTGFKGSWLALWLKRLGADVLGYSIGEVSEPSHWGLIDPPCQSVLADVRDLPRLTQVFEDFKPEIVFHLAAQSLVRPSYEATVDTFASNVMGTVNLLEAARQTGSARAVVVVTTDKCYENRGWAHGYTEQDAMGGHDPYSASKACAELITASYRRSFFDPAAFGDTHEMLIASARAGNVIGGGDWAVDRLVPDIIRAIASHQPIEVRKPEATRPWQHVLNPLAGYLLLGQQLFNGHADFATGWNFGPDDQQVLTVREVFEQVAQHLPSLDVTFNPDAAGEHEADLLQLDSSKAHDELGWQPVWDGPVSIERTARWYAAYLEDQRVLTTDDLDHYFADARTQGAGWAQV